MAARAALTNKALEARRRASRTKLAGGVTHANILQSNKGAFNDDEELGLVK